MSTPGLTIPRPAVRRGRGGPAASARPPRRQAVSAGVRAQSVLTAAQLASGLGNLAFALVLARLGDRAYAQVAAFLAAYLLIHVPLSSLTAGSALRPDAVPRLRRRAAVLGLAGGAALAAVALPLSGPLHLPPLLLVALAATVPVAGGLALERGRLIAAEQHGRAAATMVVEPLVRLGVGVALASRFGAVGAAAGVVLGGYAALAIGLAGRHAAVASAAPADLARRTAHPALVTAAFALLAVVQSQDALWANGLLESGEAGRFAVLSTLGGVAAFATAQVPLVLLPRAARGEPGALRIAVLLAAGLGAAATVPFLVAPDLLVGAAFGERHAGVGRLAVPYLLAMGLLGVARVLLAYRCATGRGRDATALIVGATALQVALLVTGSPTAAGAARATLLASAVLLLGALALRARDLLAGPAPADPVDPAAPAAIALKAPAAPATSAPARGHDPVTRGWDVPDGPPAPEHAPGRGGGRSDALALALACAAALGIRLASGRSLWLDEATSVAQSHLGWSQMLDSLRSGDVHPPLHDAILWLLVRAAGDGEIVLRLPSLVAGVALIPVMYLAARELWDRAAGRAAAALAVVAPFPVWYAQEARMYALFLLFATLAILGQARALRRGDAAGWAIYAAATILLVWTHYFALLFVGVQQAAFALVLARRGGGLRGHWHRLRAWLAADAVVAAACLPALVLARAQFAANEAAGKGFSDAQSQLRTSVEGGHAIPDAYDALTNGVWALLGYHSEAAMARLTALWPVLILAALLVLGRGAGRGGRLLVALVVLPMVALFALGQVKPFVFEVRYAAGAVPALLLLGARVLTRWTPSRTVAVAATATACGILLACTADQQLSRTNPRLYDFEGALTRIEQQARPGDVLVYEPEYLDDLVRYYAPGIRTAPLKAGIPQVARGRRVFVLASFLEQTDLRRATNRGLAQLATRHRLVDRFTRPQVRVWEYQR